MKQEYLDMIHAMFNAEYQRGYAAGLKSDTRRDDRIDKQNIENVKKAYEQGINKMWQYVRFLYAPVSEGGLTLKQLRRIFGSMFIGYIISRFSAEEIIKRIEAYKKAQKSVEHNCNSCVKNTDCGSVQSRWVPTSTDDGIKVGDELMTKDGGTDKGVATCVDEDGKIEIMWNDGSTGRWHGGQFEKTGKHFPQLKEVLEQLEEDT